MSSPILSVTEKKKVLNFSETSHVSFTILLSSKIATQKHGKNLESSEIW
jgi:hypothetical protein